MEGELRIDNEDFTAALADPDSDDYKSFTQSFSNALRQALFSKEDSEFLVEVIQLR